jgi:pimeloyl-ACP methyl ester carboxylesterase
MRWVEWGDPANPKVLVCVHGLTRCGRDFDFLASRLADTYRVICPDVAGRGTSDWLAVKADYLYPTYLADMNTLLVHAGAEQVDWVGTSMGGLIGMLLASLPGTPVRKLVLNDVGPYVPRAALERIGAYLGVSPVFDTLEMLEMAMRSVSPFGELGAAQWRHLAEHVSRQEPDGHWRFRYDPGIAEAFKEASRADVDLAAYWNSVAIPVLVVRGEHSDLLTPDLYARMLARPGTSGHVVANTGHAPMLMDDAQVGAIRAFLAT